MNFTLLPLSKKSAFGELYQTVRKWLWHRKCPHLRAIIGDTFYDHALSSMLSERMDAQVIPIERFGGRHLFHYTSLEVFKLLREKGADLACTRFSMLNDSEELKRGFSEVLETFASGREPIQMDEPHRTWLQDYFETTINDGIHGSWIMSFSELDDELYQWSAYTDRRTGGCAIAFDVRELYRIAEAYRSDKDSLFDVYLLPCAYFQPNFTTALFGSLYTLKDRINAFAARDLSTLKGLTPLDVLGEAWNCIVMVAALNKHYCFASEREWRLVMIPKWNVPALEFPQPNLVAGKMRYFLHQASSKNRKHYTPKCIRGIMLSPHCNKDFNRTLAKEIIGSDNDPNCRILESYLPYNGR